MKKNLVAKNELGIYADGNGVVRADSLVVAQIFGNIGINKLECLLRSPRCPFVLYVGKKKLVKRKEFEKFISDNIEI